MTQTRYINTISPEQEPFFPGDESIELRIRRIIRWNAVAMVPGEQPVPGIGGHLATYASAASLYEVEFNRLLQGQGRRPAGRPDLLPGPWPPGIYGRAPRGRLSEDQLDQLPARVEPGRGPAVLPTRGSCRTSGSSRRSRWGWGRSRPSTRPASTATSRTAASSTRQGPGSGRSSATARPTSPRRSARSRNRPRGLDNLTFVVNCNLQRLDGPVRGNGKIIQELVGIPGAPAGT